MQTPRTPLCCFCGQGEPDLTMAVIPYKMEVFIKAGVFTAHDSCFTSVLDPTALNQWKEPVAQDPH